MHACSFVDIIIIVSMHISCSLFASASLSVDAHALTITESIVLSSVLVSKQHQNNVKKFLNEPCLPHASIAIIIHHSSFCKLAGFKNM